MSLFNQILKSQHQLQESILKILYTKQAKTRLQALGWKYTQILMLHNIVFLTNLIFTNKLPIHN
jgi:hypothetical protein